ncbi:MAG TPA: GMC oxidoreductase [Terriglobia bacterium]|nr:GMC oxidoreductase [Terriglobia bacterium]
MKAAYDVVVVGSGFGGAISACRLAEAGRSVCVLERGKRWSRTDFPRSPGQVANAFWRDNKSYGFLDYRVFKRIDVIQGCGVGGGSLHYFNVHLRTPHEIFMSPAWPKEVKRAVLDPYYSRAECMLGSQPLSPSNRALPPRTQAFGEAAAATGRKAELVPIGVYTGEDRLNPHSGIPQSGCDYSGNCLLGCDLHAKNTVDITYLAVAEKSGAEVFPLHRVEKIEPDDQSGYRVHFRRTDPADPGRSEPGMVAGRKVILAAGTLGTTELLLRCRDLHRTLPNIGVALGSRFSANGDFLLAATLDSSRHIDPAVGPSITVGTDFSTADNRIFIEDLGYPEPFMWLLEGAIPNASHLKNLFRSIKSYIRATVGADSGRIAFEADRLFRGGVTTRMLPYLGMGTDAADGRLKLTDGCIDIQWSHRRSRPLFNEIERALKDLSAGLDGRYETSPLWRWPLRKLLTAHPLGGCPMGDQPDSSVVRHQGELWGCPNLYVADGSAIPSALSVNPSLTISALAERVAFWMSHGCEMQPGEAYVVPPEVLRPQL